MDNSQVASCQNFLMSVQSASNLDLYFSPWESHYVSKGKTILKFNKQEHICKKLLLCWTMCCCYKWLIFGNELIQTERKIVSTSLIFNIRWEQWLQFFFSPFSGRTLILMPTKTSPHRVACFLDITDYTCLPTPKHLSLTS